MATYAQNAFEFGSPNDGTYRESLYAGLAGGTAGLNKQWLPSWDGEILRAYDEYNVFSGLVMSKSIPGVSAEFPITGTVKLKPRWGAGEELIGNTNEHKSDTIAVYIDRRPMAVYFETDNIDEFLTQWEHRAELARQGGQTLANTNDKRLAAYILRAAAESWSANDPRPVASADPPVFQKDVFAHLGGVPSAGSSATLKTNAALELLESLEEAFIYMQENNIMTDNVICAVTPRAFQDIRALGVARDAADLLGGAGRPFFGGVAEAGGLGAGLGMGMNSLTDSLEYMGARIIKTNHLPTVNYGNAGGNNRFGNPAGVRGEITADAIGEDRYNLLGENAGVKALIWKPDCVASLQKMGVKTDTEMDVRRGTMFTVSSMYGGAGVLRPECAFAVIDSSVNPIDPDIGSELDISTYTEGNITRANLRGALGMLPEYKSTAAGDYTASYGANGGADYSTV